ncbi:conserved hypothetical protein [Methanococcus vannielii SB]|uniref:Uncharacterized protein n=1 Tax=Methanococcus vannielii (strain ATCC 35089 / DSM 1224 / JCM 13029 / OCM 148 / SB) TaxID=406327 RepID=A6USP1_METVS|nr:hypothetical protein [Methanococcus vannielii]ABR55513.1 conserved hypothetical protein [Methanococcus vannielii SB]
MEQLFEFNFSVLTDNSNNSILRCLSKYEKVEKIGFQNISPRDVMELFYETMFIMQIFKKELSELKFEGFEKWALDIIEKFKDRDYVSPIDKNYQIFTIWKNREGFLKYTLEDVNLQLETIEGFEKSDSYLFPSTKIFPHIKNVLLKVIEINGLFN